MIKVRAVYIPHRVLLEEPAQIRIVDSTAVVVLSRYLIDAQTLMQINPPIIARLRRLRAPVGVEIRDRPVWIVLIALAHDAVLSMPPQVAWYTGRTAIQRFFERARATSRGYRFVGVRANGAPAVAVYMRSPDDVEYRASGITVLCIRDGLIAQVTRFVMPYLFPRFGLPERVSGDGP